MVYYVDDRPIEVRGEGENGEKTLVTTWYNNGPNAYWYYYRTIRIMRSNFKISGIEHRYEKYVPYKDGGAGSPYTGFVSTMNCNNVVIDNFTYQSPPGYYDVDPDNQTSGHPTPTGTGMGSYEISATLANNVTWSNSIHSNFFEPNGGIVYKGSMGTNFCKNLTFDNMFQCSFDAHCGVYNGTIKNTVIDNAKLENILNLYIGRSNATLCGTQDKNIKITIKEKYFFLLLV